MPIPAAAIISAAGALLNTGANAVAGATGSRKQYVNQRKLMKYQDEINTKNWNMVNEYNLPINQKNRLLAAGINPNFSDFSTSNTASDVAPSTALGVEQSDYGKDAVVKGMQMYQAIKQSENLDANTELAKSQKAGQDLENINKDIRNQSDQFKLDLDKKFSGSERNLGLNATNQQILESNQRMSESIARIKSLLADGRLKDAQTELAKTEKYNKDLLAFANLENVVTSTDVQKEEARAIPERTKQGQQIANAQTSQAETASRAQYWREKQDTWQRGYQERLLSLERLRAWYDNSLKEAQTSHEWNNSYGQVLKNGYQEYENDLRKFVADADIDKNEKIVLLGNLRLTGAKLQKEINEIEARTDLTKEQKRTECVRRTNIAMDTSAKAVNAAANAMNALQPWKLNSNTPPSPSNSYVGTTSTTY